MHLSFEMALLFVPRANLQVLSFLLVGLESRRHIFFLVGDGGGRDEAEKDELASSLDKVLQASIILY